MQGRGTAQPGGDKAAAYLADRFAKLGLKPLGDKNSYLQPIKFRETQFLPKQHSPSAMKHSSRVQTIFVIAAVQW